jgi:hypothetical protein
MFADMVEKLKQDGDMFAMIFRSGRGSKPTGLTWTSNALRLMVVVAGAGLLFAVFNPFSKPAREDRLEMPARDEPGTDLAEIAVESDAPVTGQRPTGKAGQASAEGFRLPLDEFKQVRVLDREILDGVWDDLSDIHKTVESSNIRGRGDLEAADHLFCFLRTHTSQELAAKAAANASFRDLMLRPEELRGTVLRKRLKVLRIYTVLGWQKEDGSPLDSGVRDTTILFCLSASGDENPYIYVVLTAEPPENYRELQIYEMVGAFMKRYPYKRMDGEWEAKPLILTMRMTTPGVNREESATAVVAVIIGTLVVMLVLFFIVRGETRESETRRAEKIERRRRNRQGYRPPPPPADGCPPKGPATPDGG